MKITRVTRRIKKFIHRSEFIDKFKRNKKFRAIVIIILLLIVALIGSLIYFSQRLNRSFDVSGFTLFGEYDISDYEYNSDIISILLIGVDSRGDMTVEATYGDQARADNIDLLCFNTKTKRVTILPISRDTMTDVTKFSAKGYEVGSVYTHLAFAFSYGNGGHESSMNVCNAVSNLLFGMPTFKYVTTNIDSISYANDLIGGVSVTVPNNDLSSRYPSMVKGAKVTLNEDNVADFLRYRNTNEDGSNAGRMERQEAFLEAFVDKLKTMSKDEYLDMWQKLKSDDEKIKTNMSQKTFMNIMANLKEYTYDGEEDNLHIEGENMVKDGYDVFYPDTDKLKELVIDNFFRKR